MSRRISDDLVAAMHADYTSGLSLTAVGRKFNRHYKSVRELFTHRGLPVRTTTNAGKRRTWKGTYAPAASFTAGQIDAMVAASTCIKIPDELRTEWRLWPLERRAWFVARLRAKFPSETDPPRLPYSANVEPFVYGTPRAHAIMAALNEGCDSRSFRIKINLCSQGIIYRDRLFFWAHEGGPGVGAYYTGPWTKETGRPSLNRLLWEETHGRPVPPGHVVRHADGNRNNFTPGNLMLATRNALARENQATGLNRRSRELTAALLNRNQRQKKADHEPDTLSHLAVRR